MPAIQSCRQRGLVNFPQGRTKKKKKRARIKIQPVPLIERVTKSFDCQVWATALSIVRDWACCACGLLFFLLSFLSFSFSFALPCRLPYLSPLPSPPPRKYILHPTHIHTHIPRPANPGCIPGSPLFFLPPPPSFSQLRLGLVLPSCLGPRICSCLFVHCGSVFFTSSPLPLALFERLGFFLCTLVLSTSRYPQRYMHCTALHATQCLFVAT